MLTIYPPAKRREEAGDVVGDFPENCMVGAFRRPVHETVQVDLLIHQLVRRREGEIQ